MGIQVKLAKTIDNLIKLGAKSRLMKPNWSYKRDAVFGINKLDEQLAVN